MAEFPPNLDDGELWLPSDIFLGEVPSKFHSTRRVDAPPSTEDLAHHLAALSLFQSHAKSPSISNFQRFQQPVQYGSVDPFVAAELCRVNNVGRTMVCRNRAAPLYNSFKPVYEHNFLKPTHPQVERFVEGRERVLQNRVQCQVMAIQGRNWVGVGRECGGTGVFLPRVANTSITNTGYRKKQGPRNRRERCPMKRVEEHCCQFSPSAEMVLPHDWTY